MSPSEPVAILTIQPWPTQTLRASLTLQDGSSYTVLVRRWSAHEVGRCRLCSRCTAKVGADSQSLCIVALTGNLAEADSPLYGISDPVP